MTTPAPLQLTPQQDAALAAIREFLDSDDACFILRGYAGTGKTTLVSRLLEHLRDTQQDYLLLASTGRARAFWAWPPAKARRPSTPSSMNSPASK